jgi:hypothetical protein
MDVWHIICGMAWFTAAKASNGFFEKSSYRKLRLPIDWLEDAMVRVGFVVHRGQAGRLTHHLSPREFRGDS